MWRSVVIAVLIFAGSSASAGPNDKAANHYRQGKAFLDARLYDEAIAEFEAAYALDHLPSHLFNLASAYEAKGEVDRALDLYTRFVAAESKSPNATEARVRIAALTKAKKEAEERRRADEEARRRRNAPMRKRNARTRKRRPMPQLRSNRNKKGKNEGAPSGSARCNGESRCRNGKTNAACGNGLCRAPLRASLASRLVC